MSLHVKRLLASNAKATIAAQKGADAEVPEPLLLRILFRKKSQNLDFFQIFLQKS
jgi:hypothetical protein